MTASMFRDVKAGRPVEADHATATSLHAPMRPRCRCRSCASAYTHLKAYEKQRVG